MSYTIGQSSESESERLIHKKVRRRQNQTWQEAKVKPEYCPNTINLYAHKGSDTTKDHVRSHLKSMGWFINYRKDKIGIHRYRYRPPHSNPTSKSYVSLRQLCRDLSKGDALPCLESKTEPKRNQASNDVSLDLLQDGEDTNYDQTTEGEGFESETLTDQDSESETPIYKNARLFEIAKKANPSTTSDSQIWLEAKVKPEYCPEVIDLYVRKGSDTTTTTTASQVRSHLKHIGWSIDFLKDKGGLNRYRYRPPHWTPTSKSHYASLSEVCLELSGGDAATYLKSTTEPKGSQSSSEDESLDLPQDGEDTNYDPTPAVVSRHKDLVCPLPVIEWSNMETKESQQKDKETEDRKLKAKECLLAMGWNMSYQKKKYWNKPDRLETFYFSPTGRQYGSLKQACLGCMKEGHLKENSMITASALELANANSLDQSKVVSGYQNQFHKSRGKRKLDHRDRAFHGRDCSHSPSNAFNSDIVCHQAVIEWSKIETKESLKKDKETQDRKLKAKECLEAMGWDISYQKKGDGQQLFYFSPKGKQYGTLKQACIGCIKENKSLRTDSESKVVPQNQNQFQKSQGKRKCDHTYKDLHGQDRLHSQSSNMMLSTKTVQQVITHSSMHKSPRTILSLLIDDKVVLLGAKVFYRQKNDSLPLATGKITREGIKCCCCEIVYTLTQFEVHAGSKYCKPSAHIFLEDGRSLRNCQVEANKKRNERDDEQESLHAHENESECFICRYGGELILCDQCPSSFHKSCLGLEEVPDGDWFCPFCCCGFCGQNELEKGSNKCINCEQCERRFHVDCLLNRGASRVEINPKEESRYCSEKCEKISLALKELLGKPFAVGADNDSLTWTMRKSLPSGSCDVETLTENHRKLSAALGVMHECFGRVKAPNTQSDLTEDVIFSKRSELRCKNFRGFYTILLEKNDDLISAASVRIFGEKVAELPFIGTRSKYYRMGMCRILINELEKKLIEIGVERLVLPAVPSVLNMWTSSFGFQKMTASDQLQLLDYAFLDFQDTIKCQKFLGTR